MIEYQHRRHQRLHPATRRAFPQVVAEVGTRESSTDEVYPILVARTDGSVVGHLLDLLNAFNFVLRKSVLCPNLARNAKIQAGICHILTRCSRR
jgi:hypothetical protein